MFSFSCHNLEQKAVKSKNCKTVNPVTKMMYIKQLLKENGIFAEI